jgi:hypothetical protein
MYRRSAKEMEYPAAKCRTIFAFIALFAMSIPLFAQTAPLWAKEVNGQRIEICSAFGTRTILVDSNFNKIPEAPAQPDQAQKKCDVCFVSAVHITPPQTHNIEPHAANAHFIRYPHFNIPGTTKTKYTPQNSRAPPLYS